MQFEEAAEYVLVMLINDFNFRFEEDKAGNSREENRHPIQLLNLD